MCGYRRQEKHPYLLTLAKAPKGKKEGRSGEDGKGERIPWTQRLGEDKRHRGGERRGLPCGSHGCAKRSSHDLDRAALACTLPTMFLPPCSRGAGNHGAGVEAAESQRVFFPEPEG